jgi:uncharacterized membrane protein YecN with MAPEG domain
MMKKAISILFGIALVPFCIGFTWQLGTTVFGIRYKPDLPYFFIAGSLTYITLHVLFRKPIMTYVFGHELTHALFAVLFGGSVKSFHASDRGGRVTLTKSNFIITLAPYFFPLYTFLALLLYGTAVAAGLQGAVGWIVFLAGASFAFHLVLTALFLQTEQSDVREYGMIFSFPLIYLFNIAFTALLVRLLLAENMEYLLFLGGGIMKSINMTVLILGKICRIAGNVI